MDLQDINHGNTGIMNINLSWCQQITDEGLKYLSRCKIVNISSCVKINDDGIAHLTECENLNAAYCYLIKGYSFQYLNKLRVLNIRYCNPDEDTFQHLSDIENLSIYGDIGDWILRNNPVSIFQYLQNVTHLDISSVYTGWQSNHSPESVCIDKHLKYLINCKTLNISDNNITDYGLEVLAEYCNMIYLDISYCYSISKNGLRNYILNSEIKKMQVCTHGNMRKEFLSELSRTTQCKIMIPGI